MINGILPTMFRTRIPTSCNGFFFMISQFCQDLWFLSNFNISYIPQFTYIYDTNSFWPMIQSLKANDSFFHSFRQWHSWLRANETIPSGKKYNPFWQMIQIVFGKCAPGKRTFTYILCRRTYHAVDWEAERVDIDNVDVGQNMSE